MDAIDVEGRDFQTGTSRAGGGFLRRTREIVMSKRELIEPHFGDKRYVRRGGRFGEEADVDKSSSADQRQHSELKSKPGQGDRGGR